MVEVEVEVVDAESRLQQVQGQADNNFIPYSPLTQKNEKYWRSFSFLISILSQNFYKERNVRKFDL